MTSANISSLCLYSSISEVLRKAESGALNITQAVQNCSNICLLAWGTGNPDLAGIGANISYIFQFVLTMIFGPILIGAYSFWGDQKLGEDGWGRLKDVQDIFMDITAQFCIPVAVAAVVRLKQDAPFFEIAFLQSLLTMQFLGLLAASIATVGFRPKKPSRKDPLHAVRRLGVILLYLVVDFCFFMSLMGLLRKSKGSWTAIQQLTNACRGYRSIRPGFDYIVTHKLPPIKYSWKFWTAEYWKSWKGPLIVFGLIVAGLFGIVLLVALIVMFATLAKRLYNSPTALFALSLAFGAGALTCLVQLERKRDVMKAVTGNQYQDDQWGFGQVIAIFLWVPLIVQAIYYAIGSFGTKPAVDAENIPGTQSHESTLMTKDPQPAVPEQRSPTAAAVSAPEDITGGMQDPAEGGLQDRASDVPEEAAKDVSQDPTNYVPEKAAKDALQGPKVDVGS